MEMVGRPSGPEGPPEAPDSKPASYYSGDRSDLLGFLEQHRPMSGRALDVGCAAGVLGSELLARGFSEVVGIEPVADAAEFASQRLTKVLNSAFPFEGAGELGEFDRVVFADSLEHG
jgi:2-polyprenyl-3-methyl-5-hydroxy-6-metoxy-1,4-benzoquinol methylase